MKVGGSISAMLLSAACALLLVCALAQADTSKKASTSTGKSAIASTKKATRKGKKSRKSSWRRGQQKIDPKRAKPSGVWDQTSQKAMERFQAENGWQSKTVPDARALIKLGLGPDHEHLLNPESAMTTAQPPHTLPVVAPAEPKNPNQ